MAEPRDVDGNGAGAADAAAGAGGGTSPAARAAAGGGTSPAARAAGGGGVSRAAGADGAPAVSGAATGGGVSRPDAVDGAPEDSAGGACRVIEQVLRESDLTWESPRPGTYVTQLPGTRKLSTTCQLIVGRHTLSLNAFVVRRPDENHEAFYRWLLERNLRLYGVAYAVDRLGDVYLSGRLPLAAVTAEEVDRLLGAVLENADGSFNVLLELGFASSIRKEYAWRVSRGESTRNLAAFAHLTSEDD